MNPPDPPKTKAPKTKPPKPVPPAATAGYDEQSPPAVLVGRTAPDRVEEPGSFAAYGGVTGRLLNVQPVAQRLENWCWAACTQMMVSYMRRTGGVECPVCGRTGACDEDLTQGLQMNRRLGDSKVDCSLEIKSKEDYKACNRGGWPYFFELDDQVVSTQWSSRRHVLEERGLPLIDGGPRLRVQRPLSVEELRHLADNSGWRFSQLLDEAEDCALSWEMLTGLFEAERPVLMTFRFPEPASGHMVVATGFLITKTAAGGERRWVAICDPLPPGTGEIKLIPYEYYVQGEFGRHWRDYWVPPAKTAAIATARARAGELRVGAELEVAGVPADDPAEEWAENGHRIAEEISAGGHELKPAELKAARRMALEGLEAVERIARDAPDMAVALGMGGNFVQVFGRALVAFFASQKKIDSEAATGTPTFRPLAANEKLELAESGVKVYELTLKELKEWQGSYDENKKRWEGDPYTKLLEAPTEIIWEIQRPSARRFPFFSAVTVRRETDGWKLINLGRAYLMAAITTRQLLAGFSFSDIDTTRELVDFLWELNVLDALLAEMSKEEIEGAGEDLGYTRDEIAGYLGQTSRDPVNIDKLRVLASVRDLRHWLLDEGTEEGARKERTAEIEKHPPEVQSYLRRKKGWKPLEFETLKGLADDWDKEHPSDPIQVAQPKYILEVKQLYEIFVASDDRDGNEILEPVFPKNFFRPDAYVEAGPRDQVLACLKRVAEGFKAAYY